MYVWIQECLHVTEPNFPCYTVLCDLRWSVMLMIFAYWWHTERVILRAQNAQNNNKHIFDVKWQCLGPDLNCWKSVEHYSKTELWLRHPVVIGADQVTLFSSLYMKIINDAFPCVFSFLVWRKFDVTLLAGGGNTLGVSGELYCPLNPEHPALPCFPILSSLTYSWLCLLGTACDQLRRALAFFIHLHTFLCGYISPKDSCFLFWFRYLLSSSAIYAVPNTGGQEVQSWRWRNSSGLVLHVSQWHQIC